MEEITQEEKLAFIEKYLIDNENVVMGIKRRGNGFFIISGTFTIHTGIGGAYEYISNFGNNMRKAHEEYWKNNC